MGASASTQLPPFETVEAALTAGKTQDEIDAWHVSQEGGELTMTTSPQNGHDEFPNHSSNSETLKRIREEQPQDEEKEEKEDETSSSSSLTLTTTHQDEAAVLHALVASSLFNGLPTVTLFLIMGFVDCVGGLSRIISLSSSMHRDVNNLLERLSNQVSFAITTSGRCCLQNTMELLRMLSKRGNGYNQLQLVPSCSVFSSFQSIEALFKQRQADDEKYGGKSGSLQEFGCLHGDQYSSVRVLHSGGLVPEARFVSIEW